jgi:hypothetical protein
MTTPPTDGKTTIACCGRIIETARALFREWVFYATDRLCKTQLSQGSLYKYFGDMSTVCCQLSSVSQGDMIYDGVIPRPKR